MLVFRTVPTTGARRVVDGNDAATVFATDFVFLDADTLTVTLIDSSGTETVQTLNTDYTVEGGDGAVGSVVMVTAPATGETLVIQRAEEYLQETDLLTADPFAARTIENTFDKIVMMIQQLLDKVLRAVTLPISYTGDPVTLPAPEDGKYLVGRADLTGWDNTTLDSVVGVGSLSLPVSVANGGTANTNAGLMLKENYAVAGGSANAYTVSLSPAPSAYVAGLHVRFQANHAATGAPTLNVNSLGAKAIVDGHGATLANGGLQSGGVYEVIYDGTNFKLVGFGRPYVSKLSAIREYNSNNTWEKPDNLDYIEVIVTGAGGGGGGTPATSSGRAAAAGGGGSGEVAVRRVAAGSLSASETVTVGAGGAGGAAGANAGSDGASSSFGSLLTAAGGKGGAAGSEVGGSGSRGTVALGGLAGTGGIGGSHDYFTHGFPGKAGIVATDESSGSNHSGFLSGLGDGGGPGGGRATLGAGEAGKAAGAGGAGAAAVSSTSALAGGAGRKGRVIVKEYTVAYV